MSNQFNDHRGHRGSTYLGRITYAELYDIMREHFERIEGRHDPDAECQQICVKLEQKAGIFPNVG